MDNREDIIQICTPNAHSSYYKHLTKLLNILSKYFVLREGNIFCNSRCIEVNNLLSELKYAIK